MLQPFHIITDDFIADELRAVDGTYARTNSPWWRSAWLALHCEKRQLFHIWHFLMQSNNSQGPAHTWGVTILSEQCSLRHATGGQKSWAHHFSLKNTNHHTSTGPEMFHRNGEISAKYCHLQNDASHQCSLRENFQNSQREIIYRLWLDGIECIL